MCRRPDWSFARIVNWVVGDCRGQAMSRLFCVVGAPLWARAMSCRSQHSGASSPPPSPNLSFHHTSAPSSLHCGRSPTRRGRYALLDLRPTLASQTGPQLALLGHTPKASPIATTAATPSLLNHLSRRIHDYTA